MQPAACPVNGRVVWQIFLPDSYSIGIAVVGK